MSHSSATSRRARLTQAGAVLAAATLVAVLPATVAYAADNHAVIDFSGYAIGNPVGQHGWGTHTSHTYDFEVVDASGAALRLSNATNDAADYSQLSQLYAPKLVAKAGESVTGAINDVFELSFTVESATGGYQPELNLSVAVSGARSDAAQPQNRAGGVVNLTHMDGQLNVWTTWPAFGTAVPDWRNAGVSVPADAQHRIRYVVQFVDGDANDLASLWVDGQLVSDQLSSWENYHDNAEAFDKQSVEGPLFRISRSLPTADGIGYDTAPLFSPDVADDLAGNGLLIRNLDYSTYKSTPTAPPPPATEPGTETPGMSGESDQQGDQVSFEASGFDPFENVAITIYSTPHFAGWFRANAGGVVSGTLSLPPTIGAGQHTVQLAGANGNVALAQLTITRIAATGSEVAVLPILGAAGLLLVAGGALAFARRHARG